MRKTIAALAVPLVLALSPGAAWADKPETAPLTAPQPYSNADQNDIGANDTSATNPYRSTRDGSPSENGKGDGKAVGKPAAGAVGKADNKNPAGQYPNGTDHNAGYECDRNQGVGQTNPAHTGCTTTVPTPAPTPSTPPAPPVPQPPKTCTPGKDKACTPEPPKCSPTQHTSCTPPTAQPTPPVKPPVTTPVPPAKPVTPVRPETSPPPRTEVKGVKYVASSTSGTRVVRPAAQAETLPQTGYNPIATLDLGLLLAGLGTLLVGKRSNHSFS